MYSIKKIDVRESSTAKRVIQWHNSINSMNLKMFSLIKKLLDIKWRGYKLRNIKQELKKLIKYIFDYVLNSCFDDKRQVLNDRIHTLAYFYKDSNKKDCNDEKGLW